MRTADDKIKPMKILVTSGAWQASLACVQSLGRVGHEVYLVDQEPLLAVARSKYCRGQFFSPSEKYKGPYVNFLKDLLAKETFDLLIPISGRCVQYCVDNREMMERYVRLLLPSQEAVTTANSKTRTCAFAIEHNITIPKTYFPPNREEVLKLSEKNIYPCVVKVPISRASQGIYFADNRAELATLFERESFDGQWPIIQEYVEGDMYGVSAVAYEGRMIGYHMFYTFSQFSRGGTPPVTFSTADPRLLEEARNLIAILSWTGAIDLDYLKDKEGRYVLLEINPRFSGSLNFGYRMGVDLPLIYFRLATEGWKEQFPLPSPLPEGTMFRTVFPTEVVRCYQDPAYRWMFFKNFFRPNTKSNIYWDDPRLLWWQIKEARWWCDDIKRKGLIGKN